MIPCVIAISGGFIFQHMCKQWVTVGHNSYRLSKFRGTHTEIYALCVCTPSLTLKYTPLRVYAFIHTQVYTHYADYTGVSKSTGNDI
jgi:hypothetical protein